MTIEFLIRSETDGDRDEIARLRLAAFPTSFEARRVEQLRKDGDVEFSLVAGDDSDIIGHAISQYCARRTWGSPGR